MTPKLTRRDKDDLLEIKCCRCGEWKNEVDFPRRPSEKRTGREPWCYACKSEYNKVYWKGYYKPRKRVKRSPLGRAELAVIRCKTIAI